MHTEWSFEWDEGNTEKIKKRFDLIEIESFFNQILKFHADDLHSQTEERVLAFGLSSLGKPMVVCFTLRNNKVRVISARYMREKEARKYEIFKKNEK